eukprot:scaffold1669_cov129-Cylindrotheca_fusiformis.AAC.15
MDTIKPNMRVFYLALLQVALSVPFASAVEVLVTQNINVIQWTCFEAASPDVCCQEIEATLDQVGAPPTEDCEKLVADVPQVPTLEKYGIAQYSLVLAKTRGDPRNATQQHLWSEGTWNLQETTTSPFLGKTAAINDPTIHSGSVLSEEGGMHRQMKSSVRAQNGNGFYYLFMTIPEGMFVDLDDFVTLPEATVYSSKVCDIEKPAFVSGQHVVIVEVPASADLKISSKWHIRYPMPQSNGEAWILNFLQPQVLYLGAQGLFYTQEFANMPNILVAAGIGGDSDIVMWGTIAACCLGVLIMLNDISSVSYWDA